MWGCTEENQEEYCILSSTVVNCLTHVQHLRKDKMAKEKFNTRIVINMLQSNFFFSYRYPKDSMEQTIEPYFAEKIFLQELGSTNHRWGMDLLYACCAIVAAPIEFIMESHECFMKNFQQYPQTAIANFTLKILAAMTIVPLVMLLSLITRIFASIFYATKKCIPSNIDDHAIPRKYEDFGITNEHREEPSSHLDDMMRL